MGQAIDEVDCMCCLWFARLTMFLMAKVSPSKIIAGTLTFLSLFSACCLVSLVVGGGGVYLCALAFSFTSLAKPCQKV